MQKLKDFYETHDKLSKVVLAILGLIIIITACQHLTTPKQFSQLKTVTTSDLAMKQQLKNNRAKNLTYEFVYKPGCPDCKHIQAQTIKPIYKLQKQGRLMAFNAQNQKTLKYLHLNEVTHTPTLIVKYHGYTIYMYSGKDTKYFLRLLDGKNPESNTKFDLSQTKPDNETILNDFTHYRNNQTPVRYNSFTSLATPLN